MLIEDTTYQKIVWLENEGLPFLSAEIQAFIVGCKAVLDTGDPLPATAVAQIAQLFEHIRQAGNTAYNELDAPLTMTKVLTDLARTMATLTPAEKTFHGVMTNKLKARKPFSQDETEALLRIYSNKGF